MKKKIRLLLLIPLLIGIMSQGYAASINSYSLLTSNPQQYGKVEVDIQLTATFSNAYNASQIALDMVATSPSGKTVVQPCFYVSGNSNAPSSWKARFAPKEAGNYSYFFRLTQSGTVVANSSSSTFTSSASGKDGFLHTSGLNWTFKFDSGKSFRGIGEDYGWEPRSFENQKYRYEYMLPRLASNGANFIRTWMCPWNLPLEWHNPTSTNFYSSSSQYFNPSAIARMDQLVDLAESNGIYMMLTLNTFGDFQDDWGNNNYNVNNGGPATNPNDFFSLAASKTMFKNRLRYLVARWGYSPSIGAFEFFNEIDNAVFALGLNQGDVTQWHSDMGAYLKSIDPYGHLVTTSVSYRDIAGLNSVAAFDFNQQHIYSDPQVGDVITKIPSTIRSYDGSTGKPYVIGEYGYDWRGPDADQGAANDDNYKRGLWYGIFSPTPIAPMSWWWEMFDDRNTITYLQKIKDISNQMIAAGGGNMSDVSVSGNGSLEKFGVQCGTSYFIYARNSSGGNINTDLSFASSGSSYNVKIYNTTNGTYSDQGTKNASGGRLSLPAANLGGGTDVIYVVSNSNPVPQSPFGGTAAVIPGTIQVENYDLGGEGIAYHDANAGNTFSVFRADDVDIENSTDTGAGYDIGDIQTGEWIEYTVKVNAAGNYKLDARVATLNAGKSFHVEIDGVNVSGTINVPNTGGWQTWQTVTINNINLTAGQKVLRIVMDTDLFNLNYITFTANSTNIAPTVSLSAPTNNATFTAPATVMITASASDIDGTVTKVDFYNGTTLLGSSTAAPYNFTWSNVPAGTYSITVNATDNGGAVTTSAAVSITINPAPIVQAPYNGTAANIPGTIQAEQYDLGGEGIAYHDLTAGNQFNVFRTDDVDIETSTDTGNGYDIAAVQAGEWTEYTVNVTADGKYDIAARVATTTANHSFHIELDGQNISGTINVPNTGGWQTWQTVTVTNVALTAGLKVMRIVMDTDLFNLNYVSFTASAPVNVSQTRVVGYLTTYENFPNIIYSIDLTKLTHINIAFVNPDGSGALYPAGVSNSDVTTVVNAAHAKNVKVLAAIGGASPAVTQSLLSNSATINSFVNNIVQYVTTYNLDGIDIDIEGFDVTSSQYEAFVVALGNALHARNKLMSAAIATWFGDNVTNYAASQFDWVNVMTYDKAIPGTGDQPGPHASYQATLDDFSYFHNTKGIPASKLNLGVPFYGYGWGSYYNGSDYSFATIVNTYPGSENSDVVGSGANAIYYNGIPTIKQKAAYAVQNGSGIMIWELAQDASGSKSLLNAISQVTGTNTPVPDNLAKGKTATVSSTEVNASVSTAGSNATDGNYSTRWSSLYADPQWISVDLGATYTVNRVKLTWETAYASAYQIQLSSDGTNWTTLKSVTGNTSTTNDQTGLSGTGRYVRIYGTSRATAYGYSLYEIEVYGTAIESPYSGTAINLPGKVEAENYDLGGEGLAYHDTDAANQGGAYRTSEGVDVQTTTDTGGGYNVGYVTSGEWMKYMVNVTAAGNYSISVRVAATAAGSTFHIELDGSNISGTINVPNTGDWQTWQTVTLTNVALTAGQKVMKIVMDAGSFNLNYVTFQSSGVTNQAPTVSVSVALPSTGSFSAPATIVINATAADADGTVSKVDFYNGATLLGTATASPYAFTWSNVAVGSYTITAKATDNAGAVTTSTAVTVNVTGSTPVNQAPTVSVSAPASLNAPASVTITATASDVDGTISKVDFYNGSTLLFSDVTSPYSYTWSNVAAGTYTITAKATDNGGATTTSAAATVKVNTVVVSNPCTGVAQYVENGGYVAGSKVQNAGSQYQCKPYPYSGWCNGAAWAYGPGTGAYWSDAWTLVGSCNAASRQSDAVANDVALNNYPNPFNNITTIEVVVAEAGEVTVKVYDKTGNEVGTVVNAYLPTGTYNYSFDASHLSADLYLIKFNTNDKVITRKMIKTQ